MTQLKQLSTALSRLPKSKSDWTGLAYLAGWKFLRYLPSHTAYRIADWAAVKVSAGGSQPIQLRKNLARVVGCAEQDLPNDLVVASMRSYLRYWVEAFRLPSIVGPSLIDRVSQNVEGLDFVREAVDSGEGLILVLTHSGNWDMAGMWLVSQVDHFTTVAERLKPEFLYNAFVDYRESLGFEILPLTGGDAPMPRLRERLSEGGIVCLLGDRDLGGHGVEVEFFGEKTTMPIGAAKLAQETGARLHPVGVSFTEFGWKLKAFPRVAVAGRSIDEIVSDIASDFETEIAAHPADWHMLQPFWLADRKK